MTADERRGLRLWLLLLALASVAGATVAILLLDGQAQRMAIFACSLCWALAVAGQLLLAPRARKSPPPK